MIKELTLKYTREAGLRNCEREISKICRKVALKIAENKTSAENLTQVEQLQEYLGTPRYDFEDVRREDAVGVATGMVWTNAGGDIQVIEAAFMPGKGLLILTGQLGEVMQESCKAALTYCRANASALGIDTELFGTRDIHLHFPAGAIQKDGPSAGITIAVAIISLFINKKISVKVAMTGEITLKGRVLAIGGLKEKMLGAKRAGIRKIVIPALNRKDLDDIPEEIKQGMSVAYVERLDDVLVHVFPHWREQPAAPPTPKAQAKPPAAPPARSKRVKPAGKTGK